MGRTKKNIDSKQEKNSKDSDNQSQSNSTIHSQQINVINIDSFKKKEKMLFDVINDFFFKCSRNDIDKIINVIGGKYKISLRFLDWFVTRYCFLYKTSIQINNKYNNEQDFNVNISYKAQLKSFKKKCFDPFKRKNKFFYSFNTNVNTNTDENANNYSILTTLGQLNFFKWALSYDIINYVENNFEQINSKINYVNTFFKKNIIDDNTLSIISSDDLKSKSSQSYTNSSNISNISNILNYNVNENSSENSENSENSKNFILETSSNITNYSSFKSSTIRKKSHTYNPIVSRNIFVEL